MKSISAKEFDKKFDNGEDITEFLDIENIKSFKESHLSILSKEQNKIKIDQDILQFFPNEKSINDALRSLIKIFKNNQKQSA